jgi:heparosan-N-sulfate-glucuronate 5-epimerase
MAQGQAASLLVRMGAETGEQRYTEAAARALRPFGRDSGDRGVRTTMDGDPFYEEYPTSPASYVLNGAIYALWGLHDVGVVLDDAEARRLFAQGLDVLADNIHRWDLGYWSRYDLYPHRRVNVASAAYHELHIVQLNAMQLISPRETLADAAARFSAYASSRRDRRRALAEKAAFRLMVPR